ncbi:MAG TPA: hypothetical protein VJN43_06785 [Bryobacteraceae bacterium]|nr:hypothetical protein [Bryobacteraceae bacterium]
MKDKSLIWMSAGGMLCWLFASYGPARAAIIGGVKFVVNTILGAF